MSLLSRKEQEAIITSFERDYGKLIMQSKNRIIDKESFGKRMNELVSQIDDMTTPLYFEDDNIEFLCSISNSIKSAKHI
ncbi:MAG: hypothetical protein PQ612_09585 [Rickettsiales bacterium]|nr:hypothetical protein [Pseudomonadota bacterium]MDA0966044.1 hypothetical protein [Pseudomonadota bacterium]MDG4544226.1 hypothetical protein [Rickettsiales bacterium]MDG4546406.1 hypothetical protein [Rickettsiales bacterium]MDG4548550.1 hypothetical protein [Rickettsiales bacterium]